MTPVQHIPRLLSEVLESLLCSGSCCLLLALEVPLVCLCEGVFCSHSMTQEATEMLLQELERLCSCGLLTGRWLLGT